MVKIRYKGTRPVFIRTDGGLPIAFQTSQVYEFDEHNKRFKEFVEKLLAKPDQFEVLTEVGTKKVGKGVRTGRKPARNKTQKKVDAALKKPKGLKKGKGKAK
tara:strand:- start:480 stop:785 length:306 start_codon:yes stop_codon:yes gene_type:complete